jgi:septal ring factor EnvC (AmiA/AmiB activator)
MKKKMLILIILASLIPGILAVVQYYENETKEAQNILKENTLNEKIDSLKLDNNDLKNELKLLLKDNTKLSHQLSETALKLNDNVIGNGDLEIKIKPLTNNEFNFKFINENDLAGWIQVTNATFWLNI